MPFHTDHQTLQDLSLTETNGQPAIMRLFKPITLGGLILLKELFNHPLNDIESIQNRLDAIRFLDKNKLALKLDKEEADFIEYYLRQPDRRQFFSKYHALKDHLIDKLSPGNRHYIILRGIRLLTAHLLHFNDALAAHANLPVLIKEFQLQVLSLTEHISPKLLQKSKAGIAFTAVDFEELDFVFRFKRLQEVKKFLEGMYQSDVLLAASRTVKEPGFSYPEFRNSNNPELILEGFFHPFVAKPVANDISFTQSQNLCFITGANMAGKSTLLKSVGICTYLAHLGFPVPAAQMQTLFLTACLPPLTWMIILCWGIVIFTARCYG